MKFDPPAAALRICAAIKPRTIQARKLSATEAETKRANVNGGFRVGTPWRTDAEHAANSKAIKALLDKGMKQRDIVRKLGLSRSYVYTTSKRLGFVKLPRGIHV